MIILPFLHFFCFLVCLYLAVFVLYKDSKSILNRTCSILMLCFALWNIGDIIMHNPDSTITKGTVVIMQSIASIGWIGFASAIFCFSIAFSKKEILLKKKWFLFFVFILPLFFAYKQWTNCLTINPIRQFYGWSYSWADTIWTYLFYAYYLLFTLLAICFIYFYGRKTKKIIEKNQAKIITYSIIASLIIGTIFDVVIPVLGIPNIPSLANLFVFIFAVGLFYAIVKYRFLTITPAIAADNIISAMDEFLILLNQDGNIITVNKATLDVLQYEQKELEGKSVKMLFQEDNLKKNLLEKITKEEVIKNYDSNFLTKNRKQVPIIYSSSPLINEEGIVIGTVIIARDITERKQTEEELIRAKEKAEENDRLKTAFLHNISHEIRTPMNAIVGFSTLLGEPDIDNPTRNSYIDTIIKSSDHLLSIITDIIDFSNIEANIVKITKNEVNLNSVIRSLYEQFLLKANEKKITMVSEPGLPDEESIILTDSTKLIQIISNLLNNALKFTHQGQIKFGYAVKYKLIEFFVSDTGLGIPKEHHQRIFDRFYQAEDPILKLYEGTGLGLAICKAYVECLGGEIRLSSIPGAGSTFYFTLPFEKPANKVITTSSPIKETGFVFPVKKKILVAEDNDSNFKLISYFLFGANAEIIRASNGKEAVEKCLSDQSIDLVLMDIRMPIMNGYTAVKLIREFRPDIPIIAQTAYVDERTMAFECGGFSGIISKPFDKKDLLKVISKFI